MLRKYSSTKFRECIQLFNGRCLDRRFSNRYEGKAYLSALAFPARVKSRYMHRGSTAILNLVLNLVQKLNLVLYT